MQNRLFLFILTLILWGCSSVNKVASTDEVKITFLQLNDVYEINPLEGGKIGGLARVATIREKLIAENPNTITVMAGDFLNPSLIGTLKHEGERIRGKHMVEVLNTLGLDYACFGNHEFDLDEKDLMARIEESEFTWIAGNLQHNVAGKIGPLRLNERVLPTRMSMHFDGVNVGLFSYCLDANKVDYIHYGSREESYAKDLNALSTKNEIIVGLTHQNINDDIALAEQYTQVALVMGGHEHTNMLFGRGKAVVAKADANAKSVYVHRLTYNKKTKELSIASELVVVDDTIPEHTKTKAVADKWNAIANASFATSGFNPNEILKTLSTPYDARESTIRWKQAPYPKMMARAMIVGSKNAKIGIINSGSIRVDDVLSGQITQYDILRSLPFGGGILEVEMTGELLAKTLETGRNNTNSGGYLQYAGIEHGNDGWLILGRPLNENLNYTVAITDFLLTGLESNLGFLKPDNAGIISINEPSGDNDIRRDIRLLIIDYLKNGGE